MCLQRSDLAIAEERMPVEIPATAFSGFRFRPAAPRFPSRSSLAPRRVRPALGEASRKRAGSRMGVLAHAGGDALPLTFPEGRRRNES
jgi:hypothetical protein